jgi:hypothetical protein
VRPFIILPSVSLGYINFTHTPRRNSILLFTLPNPRPPETLTVTTSLAKVRRVPKKRIRKKTKRKAPEPRLNILSLSRKERSSFAHLCHLCYKLTCRLSDMRPTIPAAFTYGLRFQRTFSRSKKPPCSFCGLLLELVLTRNIKFKFGKPVHFVLVAPGPEEDTKEGLYDLCALNLYWEGPIQPRQFHRETSLLEEFMVSARSGGCFLKTGNYPLTLLK